MAAPAFTVVRTLTEYVSEIDRLLDIAKLRNTNVPAFQNWYRGVSQSVSHKLQPSLFRVTRADELAYLNLESQMMQDFERHAILRGSTRSEDEDTRSAILKLFHMQHYGVPTRLLDWTTNPFIALYFALCKDTDAVENPAVWVVDPWDWNRKIFETKTWIDRGPAHVSDPQVRKYHPRESYDVRDLRDIDPHPVAVVGVYNTERMRAQRGVFTLFGKHQLPMETVYDQQNIVAGCLHRIEIDRAIACEMFQKLIQMGYTDSVAYPDFHGVAVEIRRTHGYSV